MNKKKNINDKDNIFKGFKKSPFLFIFSVLGMVIITSLFLILTPIGWLILAGLYEVFTDGSTFQKIISIAFIIIYFFGILVLTDTMCNNAP